MDKSEIGQQAEKRACQFLQQKGFMLRQCNYRCKQGEIDLVMQDADVLVFVEVRYRKSEYFGSGAETIDSHKQKKLILSANHYLSTQAKHDHACRFDVVSLSGPLQSCTIDWIPDAFD